MSITENRINNGHQTVPQWSKLGPDILLNEFFKNGSETLINNLHALFNKLFQMGYFPGIWSEGYIVSMFKKGMSTRYRIVGA